MTAGGQLEAEPLADRPVVGAEARRPARCRTPPGSRERRRGGVQRSRGRRRHPRRRSWQPPRRSGSQRPPERSGAPLRVARRRDDVGRVRQSARSAGARFRAPVCRALAFRSLSGGEPRPLEGRPRAVAQLGSALDWGSRGRRFKSCQPDGKTCRSEACKQEDGNSGHRVEAAHQRPTGCAGRGPGREVISRDAQDALSPSSHRCGVPRTPQGPRY